MGRGLSVRRGGRFYASGGAAGRRGDFLTSPEVGPLFGAVVARWLDNRWEAMGRPTDFTVVEAAAGVGTLARSIRDAQPACLATGQYVMVERSAAYGPNNRSTTGCGQ
ncbi:MAG: hypothetical protein Ct9H300mP31_01990 [Acidimicrobiaceae bacterium]|nr:MAG: hypothetical protein Ct9H300mP31_01990 [Acidimicrobiaceae bacterium]